MGKNFRETLNKQMKSPEFRTKWKALEPEFQVIRTIIEGRMTQEQLSKVTGVAQPYNSRLENEINPFV